MKSANDLWSDQELSLAINAYIYMLHSQIHGIDFDKKKIIHDLLSTRLTKRNDASLRYRLRNISHVFDKRKWIFLSGYTPAPQVGSGVEKRINELLDTYPAQFLRQLQETPIKAEQKLHSEESIIILRNHFKNLSGSLDDINNRPHRGHNNPPELILEDEMPIEIAREIQRVSDLVSNEIQHNVPQKELLQKAQSEMGGIRARLWAWLSGRFTKIVDSVLVTAAPIATAQFFDLFEKLSEALSILSRFVGG